MSKTDIDSTAEAFKELFAIIRTLRGPDGCPWDREQTAASLRGDLLEEVYECVDAIGSGDDENLREELGDLYLLATMLAYIQEQENRFTVFEVLKEVGAKLVRRHPHVFADSQASTSNEVLKQWDEIKQNIEGKHGNGSLLSTIPQSLPPLEKAYRYQKKAAAVGFDWKEKSQVVDKLLEEIEELRQLDGAQDAQAVEMELGDILFAAVNLCRHYKVDPAVALHSTNSKFAERFNYIEKAFQTMGKRLSEDEFELMDALWNKAKLQEK